MLADSSDFVMTLRFISLPCVHMVCGNEVIQGLSLVIILELFRFVVSLNSISLPLSLESF